EVPHAAHVNTRLRRSVVTTVETLLQDARYGIRSLARMRGAALLAVAALALGIAATTTMFSVVDATLWRPMPLERADRLAILSVTKSTRRDGFQRMRWSRPRIADLETATTSFESIASVTQTSIAIQTVGTARGEDVARGFSRASLPEQIEGEIVSPNYFRTLRVNPAAGRPFAPGAAMPPGTVPGSRDVVVTHGTGT